MKKFAVLIAVLSFTNFALASSYTLKVDGMKCEYCAKHLERELQALGIESARFDLESKLVQVELANGQTLQHDQLKKAIENAGFQLLEVVPIADKNQRRTQ
jgi:copper chaperone CopZ